MLITTTQRANAHLQEPVQVAGIRRKSIGDPRLSKHLTSSGASQQQPTETTPLLGQPSSSPLRSASVSPSGRRIRTSRTRPRLWIALPVVALADLASQGYVGGMLLYSYSKRMQSPGAMDIDLSLDVHRQQSLCITLLVIALLRSITLSVVGLANKTDQLGLIVAAVSAISMLVLLAVVNLLFLSGELFSGHSPDGSGPQLLASPSWPPVPPFPSSSLSLLTILGSADPSTALSPPTSDFWLRYWHMNPEVAHAALGPIVLLSPLR